MSDSNDDVIAGNLKAIRALMGPHAAEIPESRLEQIAGDPLCIWILRRLEREQSRITTLETALADSAQLAAQATRHTAELAAVLKGIEWGVTDGTERYCPACGGWMPNGGLACSPSGHYPNCPLAAALAGTAPLVEAEVARLKAEALRFYRADGTFEILDSSEEVVRRRQQAAREIARLTDALVAAVAQTDQAVTHLRAVAAERDALVIELAGVRREPRA